jgi:tetratricopeptide (TPR) repeat protein
MNGAITSLVVFSFAAVTVFSCTHAEQRIARTAPDEKKGGEQVYSDRSSKKVELESTEKLAYLIRKKNYSRALNLVNDEIDGGMKEVSYEDEYVAAINGMIDQGAQRQRSGDYENSGLIFSSVIEMYPNGKSLRSRVKEKPKKLKENIQLSSEKLMEEGLSEYREGNLGNAIKIWRKILRFNAGYGEAEKAIETATVQLNNLKSLQDKTEKKGPE